MGRKFRIVVNGKAYEVDVEELGASAAAPVSTPVASAPAPAAVSAPTAAPVAAAPVPQGAATVSSPMPGKILKVNVKPGDKVSDGDVVIILEAMKMENEIFAPQAGTVAEVRCKEGDSVNSGDVLLVVG
jgi:glutaconyl-CoA decarboxylase